MEFIPKDQGDNPVFAGEIRAIAPEYELERGLTVVLEAINKKISEGVKPVVVGIAGGSASGKSLIASRIRDMLEPGKCTIISMDDYCRGSDFITEEREQGNAVVWDQPEAIDLSSLSSDLDKLKQGELIQKPIYSMRLAKTVGREDLSPSEVIIVEGLFALQAQIVSRSDIKIFIKSDSENRLNRRIKRDVERTGDKPEEIAEYCKTVVEPMYVKNVLPSISSADFVLNN